MVQSWLQILLLEREYTDPAGSVVFRAFYPNSQAWLCLRGCRQPAKAQQCSSVQRGAPDILVRGL